MKWCGARGILLLIMVVLFGGRIERASAFKALPSGFWVGGGIMLRIILTCALALPLASGASDSPSQTGKLAINQTMQSVAPLRSVRLVRAGQTYVLDTDIADLDVVAPDVVVNGAGGRIFGDLRLHDAPRSQVNWATVGGLIYVKDSSAARVVNSRAAELLVEGGEDVSLHGNVIIGGCNATASNGITITGQICSSMYLKGTGSFPFTNSTIRYNIIRNTSTNLQNEPGDLGTGRMSEIVGAIDRGDQVGGPCPNTRHVVEYNLFEGRHQGSSLDDEPYLFRFRCAKGTASNNNIIRYNTFLATGVQTAIQIRDHVDFTLFEGNALITNFPNKHYGAFVWSSGNNGTYSDDPSDNLIVRNLITAENPQLGALAINGAGLNNVFRQNVIRSGSASAGVLWQTSNGRAAVFEHNTIIGNGTGEGAPLAIDGGSGSGSTTSSYNIIVGPGGATYDSAAQPGYRGDHNLYYNGGGSVHIPSEDADERTGNPSFLNPANPNFDYRIGANSAARASGGDTSDRGAFQFSQSCSSNWTCSNWSACVGGAEIRICPGLNDCGQPNPQPYQTRACGSGGTPTPTDTLGPSAPANLRAT